MPGVLYRCVFCETSHEVARRADGPVYLRCPTTYQWAWYDVRAFETPRLAKSASGAARGTAVTRRHARASSTRRRSLASSGAKVGTARRAGRRSAPRASARRRPRKGGRH
jgi:hypothetical protein